ncbi:MAG: fatty acid desaturase [Pseudomonadales bacterium]|nr:fatty acid desaturase [Pseudomonadales bacterium]
MIPALFFPLGITAVTNVFLTSLLAEVFTNLHSFLAIVPNHSGDDIVRFKDPIKKKQEFYYRQAVGSVNYTTGSDFNDFMHGWLNYQIEHHLFPALPLSQYQKIQPEVKAICEKYGVEYKQESIFKRLIKAVNIMTGKTSMKWDN